MHSPYDPYYDHSPRLNLDKPVALCGYFGSGVPELAFKICAHTGLPLHDFERAIEHKIGCRIAHYSESLREVEIEVTRSALKQKPSGILMLRPTTLSEPKIRQMIKKQATTIYIQRDIFVLYANILDIIENKNRTRFHSLNEDVNITTLQRDATKHVRNYKMADVTIKAGNQHAALLYERLLKIIGATF